MTSLSAIPKSSAAQAMAIPQRMKNPTTGQFINLSSTPGGSIFGTTPGGTRIQYDRSALLNFRNSPLSKSPAMIPQAIINLGVTTDSAVAIPEEKLKQPTASSESAASSSAHKQAGDEDDEELFEMDG